MNKSRFFSKNEKKLYCEEIGGILLEWSYKRVFIRKIITTKTVVSKNLPKFWYLMNDNILWSINFTNKIASSFRNRRF